MSQQALSKGNVLVYWTKPARPVPRYIGVHGLKLSFPGTFPHPFGHAEGPRTSKRIRWSSSSLALRLVSI